MPSGVYVRRNHARCYWGESWLVESRRNEKWHLCFRENSSLSTSSFSTENVEFFSGSGAIEMYERNVIYGESFVTRKSQGMVLMINFILEQFDIFTSIKQKWGTSAKKNNLQDFTFRNIFLPKNAKSCIV